MPNGRGFGTGPGGAEGVTMIGASMMISSSSLPLGAWTGTRGTFDVFCELSTLLSTSEGISSHSPLADAEDTQSRIDKLLTFGSCFTQCSRL